MEGEGDGINFRLPFEILSTLAENWRQNSNISIGEKKSFAKMNLKQQSSQNGSGNIGYQFPHEGHKINLRFSQKSTSSMEIIVSFEKT